MVRKIYGKHVANYKWHSTENTSVIDRCLEIYELKSCIKAVLWNSGISGWREEPNKPIANLMFYNNERNMASIMSKFNVPSNAAIERNPIPNHGTIRNN